MTHRLYLLIVPLVGVLLAVPAADAGNYYSGGCHAAGYYQYYTPASYYPQYSQTYYPPAPAVQQTCYNTPAGTVCSTAPYSAPYANVYNTPVETFYRVAPDLAQARIAQEAAAETLKSFKAELVAQAEAQKRAEAERNDQAFKSQVLQMLAVNTQTQLQGRGATGYPTGPDQATAQLQQENAQLRASLDKLAAEMQRLISQPQPKPPAPSPEPTPPAPQPSAGKPGPVPTDHTQLVALAKQTFATDCMPCHQQQGRLNLTDPSKLFAEDWAEIVSRVTSEEPDFQMPPPNAGKASPTVEQFRAFQRLQPKSPHRPKVQGAPQPPSIPPGK
jgi:hypothetical protein